MDLIPYAVPFFILLILVELLVNQIRGSGFYRLNDALNSLSMGGLSTLSKLVVLNIGAQVFGLIEQDFAVWQFDVNNPWLWIFSFVLYDLCYYWNHRIGHERQLFWASHVAHHQSEEYNLTTALRQTSTSFTLSWLFYVPCFLIGIPPEVFFTVGSLNLIYQFWVHTRYIPKLGWYEWIFITPSNHRVHHARNPVYLDRNYGGVLILWDRLFGTYQEELDEVVPEYGISKPIRSWNPIWANLHIYSDMLKHMLTADRFSEKCQVLLARTGWVPPSLRDRQPELDIEKYDPPHSQAMGWYCLLLFVLTTLAGGVLLQFQGELNDLESWTGVALITASYVCVGMLLERGRIALKWDLLRWAATALIAGIWLA